MTPRIALLGFSIECNRFAPVATEADFATRTLFRGPAMLAEARAAAPRMLAELPGFVADMHMAQQLAEKGMLEDPEDPRFCNVLWNVVGGGSEELVPEVYRGDLALGDSLLLCTDGLTKHVEEAELARMLAAPAPARETCRALVDAANAAGGSDNITVVVAHFRNAPQPQRAAAEAEVVAVPG